MAVILFRVAFFAALFFGVIAVLNGCAGAKYFAYCGTHPGDIGCQ